jgi:hypothetical protein
MLDGVAGRRSSRPSEPRASSGILTIGALLALSVTITRAALASSASAADGAPDRWRGLEVRNGRLWFGPLSRLSSRPRLRFDPDALVLVDKSGRETRHLWDDHDAGSGEDANAHATATWNADVETPWYLEEPGPARRAASRWRLRGRPRTGRNRPAVVVLGVGRGDEASEQLLAATEPLATAEVPALATYLAVTPKARAGLMSLPRVAALLDALRDRRWRHPAPPVRPVRRDRLDGHDAVTAVLARYRWIDGRAVQGEPVPSIERLAQEAAILLPGAGPGIEDEAVTGHLRRHLGTGRWPFDALLPTDDGGHGDGDRRRDGPR